MERKAQSESVDARSLAAVQPATTKAEAQPSRFYPSKLQRGRPDLFGSALYVILCMYDP